MAPRSRGPNKFTMKDFMKGVAIEVKRTDAILRPDPSRVLLRPFSPADLARSQKIVNRIMAIPKSDLGLLLAAVETQFSPRHGVSAQVHHGGRHLQEAGSNDWRGNRCCDVWWNCLGRVSHCVFDGRKYVCFANSASPGTCHSTQPTISGIQR
jgi:hypothetical protein